MRYARPAEARPKARGQRLAAALLSINSMEELACAKCMHSDHHNDLRIHYLSQHFTVFILFGTVLGYSHEALGRPLGSLGRLGGVPGTPVGGLGALHDPAGLPKGHFGAPWTLLRCPRASLGCPKRL